MNQTIGVNITPQSFQPTLHYSQGDVGRVFVINVTDYDIPTGATVTCVATKPSGMGFTVSGTVSGNTVTFTSTAEMTDEWGRFPAEIRIASGSTLLGTANFLMIGEKDPHPASTIDGTQEELIPQLTLLVNRIEAAAESVHDLTVSATTLAAGSDATATYDSTNNSIAFGIPRGADGDVTRSEFNDLKSDFNNIVDDTMEVTIGKNLCPPKQFDGYLESDGRLTAYSDWKTTDFIDLKDVTNIVASGASKNTGIRAVITMFFLCTYDENKQFIQQVSNPTDKYTKTDGVRYIRFSFHNDLTTNIQVESGNGHTNYEPYTKTYTIIDNPYVAESALDGIFEIPSAYMESGGITYTTPAGVLAPNVARIRTKEIPVKSGSTLNFEEGTVIKQLFWFLYLPDGTLRKASDWRNDGFKLSINDDCVLRLVFKASGDSTPISPSDYDATTVIRTTIRNEIDDLDSNVNALEEAFDEAIKKDYQVYSPTFSLSPSAIEDDGNLIDTLTGTKTTDYIDCSNWVGIRYTGSSWLVCRALAFYDKDKVWISSMPDTGDTTEYADEIVSIPLNAKYVIFADLTARQAQTLKIEVATDYVTQGKWVGKKWTCVGDSLTEANLRTTMNYHDYVANATGITVVNMGRSGTGYKRTYDEGYAFYQRISSVPTDSDVVTIFGSGNDLLYSDNIGTPTDIFDSTNEAGNSLCACINHTIDLLIGIMPTVQLGIVAPTPWVGEKPTLDNSNSMGRYVEALRQICYIRSIPFLDLYHCSNLRPWTAEGRTACYSKDNGGGVHPDENGHKLIASRFKAFLETLLI